jgi:DNA-binding NarL/FixJ family response regulator
LAGLAAAQGHLAQAVRLAGAAATVRQAIGAPCGPVWIRMLEQQLAPARHGLSAAAWAAAWAAGQTLTLEQAIADALAVEPAAGCLEPPASHPPDPLTPREREIAGLVARGLTNRQIAADLSISERTVSTHLTRVLGKLGFTTRSQAAAWVVERGLAAPTRPG